MEAHRAVRGSDSARQTFPGGLSGAGGVVPVRRVGRRQAAAGAGRFRRRNVGPAGGQGEEPPGSARSRRNPRRRNRRQRCRVPAPSRASPRRNRAGHTIETDPGLRAGLQRGWPRAFRQEQSPEPAWPGGDGLAHDCPELKFESRLHKGRQPGDGSDAQTASCLGPHSLRRFARDRRGRFSARRSR